MKRLILSVSALLLLSLVTMASTAAAYTPFGSACKAAADASSACSVDGRDPITGKDGILRKTSIIVASIAGVAAVIVMIIGGLQYVTSNGDPQKTANARSAIIGAAIGLGIIVAAQGIIVFVLTKVK